MTTDSHTDAIACARALKAAKMAALLVIGGGTASMLRVGAPISDPGTVRAQLMAAAGVKTASEATWALTVDLVPVMLGVYRRDPEAITDASS